MTTSKSADTYMKEHEATLLKNCLDSLYILRHSNEMNYPKDHEQIVKAIAAVTQLRDYLTRAHGLPQWIDTWGQPRRWEHPSK
jgi:protein associated with RNAse G/E